MPFQIIRNDITRVRADIIVNTANPQPIIGAGTDSAVYAAAGAKKLLAARKKIGVIPPGSSAVTPAFHLHAKHIIHTSGPAWVDGNHGEREILHSCYASSLSLAADLKAQSIAFPLIAAGVYGFPKDEALNIALSEIGRFLLTHDMMVTLVVFDRGAFELSEKLMGEIDAFIDDHEAAAVRETEYGAPSDSRLRRRTGNARRRSEDFHRWKRDTLTDFPPILEDESVDYTFADQAPAEMSAPSVCMSESWDVFAASAPAEMEMPSGGAADHQAAIADSSLMKMDIPALDGVEGRVECREGISDESAVRYNYSDSMAEDLPMPAMAMGPRPALDQSLEEILSSAGETFQQRLFRLIDESGMSDAAVYKKANIDRRVFSRMRSRKDYKPRKETAVAFAVALELDWETTEDLLSRAGIAFSPSDRFDLIIQFFVMHHNYDIYEINAALFKYGQPILGEAS